MHKTLKFFSRLIAAPRFGINRRIVEKFPRRIERNAFATRAKPWVDGDDGKCPERRSEQEVFDVFGKDVDRLGIGLLLERDANIGFDTRRQKPLIGIATRFTQKRRKWRLFVDMHAARYLGYRPFLIDLDLSAQKSLSLATANRQKSMTFAFSKRRFVFVILLEF